MIENIINILIKYGHVFFEGMIGTLSISFIVVLVGTILGGFIALLKMNQYKLLNFIASLYIELIRGTPILLQLYLFYYLGDQLVPNQLSDTFWVILALIINSSAYVSEIFRAGIQAVDKGQFEAGESLGLTNNQLMRYIILPQAIKNILPALGNEFITMIKETSLASIFFITSLMTSESIVSSATHLKIEVLIIVGIIYFLITFVLSKFLALMERKSSNA